MKKVFLIVSIYIMTAVYGWLIGQSFAEDSRLEKRFGNLSKTELYEAYNEVEDTYVAIQRIVRELKAMASYGDAIPEIQNTYEYPLPFTDGLKITINVSTCDYLNGYWLFSYTYQDGRTLLGYAGRGSPAYEAFIDDYNTSYDVMVYLQNKLN